MGIAAWQGAEKAWIKQGIEQPWTVRQSVGELRRGAHNAREQAHDRRIAFQHRKKLQTRRQAVQETVKRTQRRFGSVGLAKGAQEIGAEGAQTFARSAGRRCVHAATHPSLQKPVNIVGLLIA